MPLLPDERSRVKYHLGYGLTTSASSLSFGMARPIQTLFLVELAMTNLIEDAVPEVRRIVTIMNGVECKLVEAQDRLAAESLGALKLRSGIPGQSEPDLLEKEYARWGMRLADILMVPLYPYSQRFRGALGIGSYGSIPVQR